MWQIKVAINVSIHSISKLGERGDWSLLITARLFTNVEHSQLNMLNTLIPPGAQNEYIIIMISVALCLFLMWLEPGFKNMSLMTVGALWLQVPSFFSDLSYPSSTKRRKLLVFFFSLPLPPMRASSRCYTPITQADLKGLQNLYLPI